jgi:uncharacterized membrane protein YkvA (DUF1232 family)
MRLRGRLRAIIAHAKGEGAVYRLALRDRRTPWVARGQLGLALAYLAAPIDIIADCIPVLGAIDDLGIIYALIYTARVFIPRAVMVEARALAHNPAFSGNGEPSCIN